MIPLQEYILAVVAVPASVFASVLGFITLQRLLDLLQQLNGFLRSTDIQLLRTTLRGLQKTTQLPAQLTEIID